MRKLLLLITIALAGTAYGQNCVGCQRYDNFAATTASASGIGNLNQSIPNATVTVYNQPGAGVSCSGGGCVAATTYASRNGAACGGGLPLTRPTGTTCLSTADAQGNFGFWAVAGAYQYCIAATNFTTQCYNTVLAAPVDANNTFTGTSTTASLNSVFNPATCALTPAPSWCAGVDMGGWINAAYAACPSTGCEIDVFNTSNVCLAYTTPIVLNTSGKYVQLVGHGGRGTTGGACLNFTPTSGIAITLDYVPTSVATYPPQHGIRDITFINNNCTTSGGCGGSAFGINFGSTNWGASNAVFDHVAVVGFAFGYNNGNTNNIPSPTWIAPLFQANGIAFTNGANTNNIFLGGFFVGNGGGIQATAVAGGEYSFDQTNFAVNSGPLFDFTRNTTRAFVTCMACHFEDSPSASASSPHFITGSVDFRIYGGVMETDQTSGTQDWFVSIAAGGVLEIHGLELLSAGKSLTQAFLLNTTARGLASLTNISPAQIPTIYGGAGATQSFLNVMTTNTGSSQTINTQTIATSLILTNLLMSTTAPTITGHFNTSGDSISNNNGTAAFTVTVGTGTAGSTGTVGLPTAQHGWSCSAQNQNRGAYIQQTSNTTASATFTNYGTTVGTPVNWTNSDVLNINCNAF